MANLVLTKKAQVDRDSFYNIYPFGNACDCKPKKKCHFCKHPGNPKNQEHTTFWMDEKERRQLDNC